MNIDKLALPLICALLVSACDTQSPVSAPEQPSMSSNISSGLSELGKRAETADAVAIVNGKAVPRELFIAYQEFRKSGSSTNNTGITEQEALDELINMQLLVQKAERENLHKNPVVAMLLRLQHDGILAERVMKAMLNENRVTEEMLKQEYDKQYAGEKQLEYQARHILVKEEAEAVALIKQLHDGSDFATLAKENSIGPSAPYGGELDWFTLDSVVPEFAGAVSALSNHQITSTPVKTRYGWHVIQLQESREIHAPPLEEVSNALLATLKTRMLEASIESLRQQADIQILQPVNQPQAGN